MNLLRESIIVLILHRQNDKGQFLMENNVLHILLVVILLVVSW